MQNYPTSIISLYKGLNLHKELIVQMTKRNVIGRYKGSVFGLLWSFFNPLIMLLVYTFAFSVVFKAKWGVENESHLDFALILFGSLIVFNLFAEVIRDSPTLIISHQNYVKKVLFPLELLPVISLLSALFHFFISLFALMVLFLLAHGKLPWTLVLLPIVLLPLLFLALGIGYFLSSIGVYIRDAGYVIGHLMTVLLFTSPVFFSIDKLPVEFQKFMFLNPVAYLIESARNVMVFEKYPEWNVLAIYFVIGLVSLHFGYWWFQKTRAGFADVI